MSLQITFKNCSGITVIFQTHVLLIIILGEVFIQNLIIGNDGSTSIQQKLYIEVPPG